MGRVVAWFPAMAWAVDADGVPREDVPPAWRERDMVSRIVSRRGRMVEII